VLGSCKAMGQRLCPAGVAISGRRELEHYATPVGRFPKLARLRF
jgi:hypothetical protein